MKRSAIARGTSELTRSPMPPRSPRTQRAVAATRAPHRTAGRDTIPPAVRRMVAARDPWCVRCGSPTGLHQHHRRLKGHGGDTRPHTDCPCNLVRLCNACHSWAHAQGRREAEGLIIPAETVFPGAEAVMIHEASDSGIAQWLGCSGNYLTTAPEGSVPLESCTT